jgi:hypothetical protein
MFKRAAAQKAKQQRALTARKKRVNAVNRQSPGERIISRQQLRSHVQAENEQS